MRKMLALVVVLVMVLPVVVSVAQDQVPAAVEVAKTVVALGTVKVSNDGDGSLAKAELVCTDGKVMSIKLDVEGKKLASVAGNDQVKVAGTVVGNILTVKKFEVIKPVEDQKEDQE